MRIVTVGELTSYLKALLEEDYYLQDVWVQGEISNYSQSSVGHRYFSLKDESANLRCVLFASRHARPSLTGYGSAPTTLALRNGMAVLAHGRLSMYEQRGDVQFYVDEVQDAGVGLLHLRFEALKARLEAEGLFDEARKRPLPERITTVGVVTSPNAAALRDILRTLRLRCPLLRVILAPAAVQGEGAADQVAAGIDALNAHGEAEVILVARGGGSIEELWAFNEEVVARAIARSRAPIVSGVGHETDFTIADFVADLRASTPTAAATLVAPDAGQWRDALTLARQRMSSALADRLYANGDALASLEWRLNRASPGKRIATAREQVEAARGALALRLRHQLELRRASLQSTALRLHTLSPLLTLARGYAIARSEPDGALITSVTQVAVGQGISVQVGDGRFAAVAGLRIADGMADATEASDTFAANASLAGDAAGDAADAHATRQPRQLRQKRADRINRLDGALEGDFDGAGQ